MQTFPILQPCHQPCKMPCQLVQPLSKPPQDVIQTIFSSFKDKIYDFLDERVKQMNANIQFGGVSIDFFPYIYQVMCGSRERISCILLLILALQDLSLRHVRASPTIKKILLKTSFPTFAKYIGKHKKATTLTVYKISRLKDRR